MRTPLRNALEASLALSLSMEGLAAGAAGDEARRLSSALAAAASSPRSATTTPPLNDDEGERRRNRRAISQTQREAKEAIMSSSTTPTLNSPRANLPSSRSLLALSSQAGEGNGAPPGHRSGSSRQHQLPQAALPLSLLPHHTSTIQQGAALSQTQRNGIFEEWMKIAADNKINAKNSWNVALIDYFSEITFLRDGDSINFQKASCTLDGCIKIYSTRVDSVADETGKLLNGLASGRRSRFGAGDDDGDDDEQEAAKRAAGDEALLGGGVVRAASGSSSRRANRSVETLERSFEALNLKHFDMEFAVDPLFKKMCIQFDDAGSKGYLSYTLALGSSGRLLFDSEEEDYCQSRSKKDRSAGAAAPTTMGSPMEGVGGDQAAGWEASSPLDMSLLLHHHGGSLMGIASAVSISPSLSTYSFMASGNFKNDRNLAQSLSRLSKMTVDDVVRRDDHRAMADAGNSEDLSDDNDDDDGEDCRQEGAAIDSRPAGDRRATDDLPIEARVPHYYGEEGEYGDEDGAVDLGGDNGAPCGADGPASDAAMQRITLTGATFTGKGDEGRTNEEDFLTFFDSRLERNWAGPEHWKVQRPHMRRNVATLPGAGSSGEDQVASRGANKSARLSGGRKEFVLDFRSPVAADLSTVLLRASSATISLSRSAVEERKGSRNLLPEDLHFSSADLLRLFLKPTWRIGGRRALSSSTVRGEDRHLGGPTSKAWTPHLQEEEQEQRPDLADEQVDTLYWASPDLALPSGNASERHDGEDGGDGVEDDMIAPDGGTGHAFGSDLVETFRMATSEASKIAYARTAKRVDIHQLKGAMWEQIQRDAGDPSRKRAAASSGAASADTTLRGVIERLDGALLPREEAAAMQDVSVPYFFICLLHLANENNLELAPTSTTALSSLPLEDLAIRLA